jgi:hypothetical protein
MRKVIMFKTIVLYIRIIPSYLCPSCRLHNPYGIKLPFELLCEQGIVIWQDVGRWEEVQGVISILPVKLLVPFDVLNHQVLAGELHVVGEVVDELVWLQPDAIIWLKNLVHSLHRCPVYVPTLPVSMVLLPLPPGKIANNTMIVEVTPPTYYHIALTPHQDDTYLQVCWGGR